MERHRVMATDPNDRHVLHCDENPANENKALDLGIAWLGLMNVHLLHEGVALDFRRRRPAGDELESVREHGCGDEYRPLGPTCKGALENKVFLLSPAPEKEWPVAASISPGRRGLF